MELKVPTISIIIGEGGSGGAIALASSNKILMLENAIYSVISPEGCATILWRDANKTLEASKAMKLTSKDLLQIGMIDGVISEPIGGAHRDKELVLNNVRSSIADSLNEFKNMHREEIIEHRKQKFLSIGRNKGFRSSRHDTGNLAMEQSYIDRLFLKIKDSRFLIFSIITILLVGFIIYSFL